MNRFQEEKQSFLHDELTKRFEKNAAESDEDMENKIAFKAAIADLDLTKEAVGVGHVSDVLTRMTSKGEQLVKAVKSPWRRKILKRRAKKWASKNPKLIGIGSGSAGFGAGMAVGGD